MSGANKMAASPARKSTEETTLLAAAPAPLSVAEVHAKTFATCAAYMVCSSGMMLVNKKVVRDFKSPISILSLQLAFAVIVLATCFAWTLRCGSWRDVWRYLRLISPLFTGMLLSSMLAQVYAPVGLQVVMRNLAPLVALPLERMFNEPVVADRSTWAALVTIALGVALYVSESVVDISPLDLFAGTALMLINLVLAVFERLAMRWMLVLEPVSISKPGMLFINNAGALPPVGLLLLLPAFNETWQWRNMWPQATPVDYALLLFSGVIGVSIGYTALLTQHLVSATTQLVLTNANKVIVVVVGMLFMGDPHGPLAVIGISVAIGGGAWYAHARRQISLAAEVTTEVARQTAREISGQEPDEEQK